MKQLMWVGWLILSFVSAVPRIEMDRRKAVTSLPLTITCISDVTITSTVGFVTKPFSAKGACLASGTCGSVLYTVTQNRTQGTTTLTITSVNSTRDAGTWNCYQEGEGTSGDLPITQFASVVDWNSVSFKPSFSALPSSVTPEQTVTVTVTTPCAHPPASFNWKYQQGVSGSPPSSTSTSQTSCPSGQVQTINTLSLPGSTTSLFNRQISLAISIEHDSFDPPTYTRSATSSSIQFPVPVTRVTMQEISSDNEKVFWILGTQMTLTCVTSASLPASTVNWSGLPSQTTLTSNSTPGLLKTTTSSVTFTLSKSDQGRTLRCAASNIDGQTLSQSNRAVLEVQYAPMIPSSFPNNVNVRENSNLNINCSSGLTAGNPSDTSYTWTGPGGYRKSGSVLDRRVSRSQGGSYTCTAGNSAGLSDSAQVNINVQSSPFTPNNFHVTTVGSTSLIITWTSNYNGGAFQIFHLELRSYTNTWINTLENGVADPGENSTVSTEVTGLHPSTHYDSTLFSTNVYGSSQKLELNVTTAEAAKATSFSGGLIASVAINVCLLAAVALMLFFLYRRGVIQELQCLRRGQTEDERNANPTRTSERSTAASDPYSELDHINSDKQTYSEIKNPEYEQPRNSSSPYEN